MVDVSGQIIKGSKEGHKTYAFNESHDSNKPAQMWFQESEEGLILFIVFYTQACRWSRCRGCNLPSKSSLEHVGYKAVMNQIDSIFADPQVTAGMEEIRKVIVSNNGSILDEKTFSSTALMYLMAKLNMHCADMTVLTIETRPEYIDLAELEFLSRALKEAETPAELEIAIGLEAFDDAVRNDFFDKGLDLATFETMVKKIAPYHFRLKCYLMQKPVPEMTGEQAVEDVMAAIDYLSDIATQHKVHINIHLNPTYVAFGTILETSFHDGSYTPPLLKDVARAVRHGEGKNISIYVGLNDEGLAVEGGSFLRPGDEAVCAKLGEFNKSQDYSLLREF